MCGSVSTTKQEKESSSASVAVTIRRNKLRIQYLSDIHLEHSDYTIINESADVLVLAGDICVVEPIRESPNGEFAKRFLAFFERVSRDFPNVIYVMGNHEFYSGKFNKSILYMKEVVSQFPNIHLLENESITIEGVIFVGGTLWTDMNKCDPSTMYSLVFSPDSLSDYKAIRNDYRGQYRKLSALDTIQRFGQTSKYIKQVCNDNPNSSICVVTHHAPCSLSISDKYRDRPLTNGGYYSDLSDLILDNQNIKAWIHGHIHHKNLYKLGDTVIASNARGYCSEEECENTGFDPKSILEI